MDPQTTIRLKPALIAIGIVVLAFCILVFGSYEIGVWKAIGSLIVIYGLVIFIGGISAIVRKRNYVMMKKSTILIIGIVAILLGALFIFLSSNEMGYTHTLVDHVVKAGILI